MADPYQDGINLSSTPWVDPLFGTISSQIEKKRKFCGICWDASATPKLKEWVGNFIRVIVRVVIVWGMIYLFSQCQNLVFQSFGTSPISLVMSAVSHVWLRCARAKQPYKWAASFPSVLLWYFTVFTVIIIIQPTSISQLLTFNWFSDGFTGRSRGTGRSSCCVRARTDCSSWGRAPTSQGTTRSVSASKAKSSTTVSSTNKAFSPSTTRSSFTRSAT